MVGREVWDDLRETGIPILAVGDHGQLPPVGRDNLSLIQAPDLCLEKIHRQAEANPIIALSKAVREIGNLPPTADSPEITRLRHPEQLRITLGRLFREGCSVDDLAVICRYNKTRTQVNRMIRDLLGFSGVPREGDPVICLKNQKFPGGMVSNGMRGIWDGPCVEDGDYYTGSVRFQAEGLVLEGRFNRYQFNRSPTFGRYADAKAAGHRGEVRGWDDLGLLFDYAGCLSCHKSQGSQWKNVLVIEELPPRNSAADDHQRWLYTAITRAEERLYLLGR